jgi:hypothetical protein
MLAFACMYSVGAVAIAETPHEKTRSVSVPAGELIDALESLAKQCGVDIIYPSGELEGRRTQGLTGAFPATEAFKRLIEGTPLVVREEGGALLITRIESAPRQATAQGGSADPIEEVVIEAQRAKLSALRSEIDKLEYQFYLQYNRINADKRYDVVCRVAIPLDSHVERHVCQPAFLANAASGRPLWDTGPRGDLLEGGVTGSSEWYLQQNTPEYRKHMVDVVARHPELLDLLKKRSALAERYQVIRAQKFKGRFIVWD